jgi:hypothetical protein
MDWLPYRNSDGRQSPPFFDLARFGIPAVIEVHTNIWAFVLLRPVESVQFAFA